MLLGLLLLLLHKIAVCPADGVMEGKQKLGKWTILLFLEGMIASIFSVACWVTIFVPRGKSLNKI